MAQTEQEIKILRPTIGVRAIFFTLYLAGIVLLNIKLPFDISEHYKPLVLAGFVILGAFAVIDVFLRRIVLQNNCMMVVSLSDFVYRTITRSEIESVTWEKGCGASLKFYNGKWMRLPNIGLNAQVLTNTIRAWLKRTAHDK